jgi:esterase/lipase
MWPFSKKKEDLIVLVHGFGTKASKEFIPLENHLHALGYETLSFDLFDPTDISDTDETQWIKRAEENLQQAFKQNKNIILLGFSMGGVIASYLASVYPIKKLILVAPAFSYINLDKVEKSIYTFLKSLVISSPETFVQKGAKAFTQIVSQYKNSIAHVDCPVLLLQGSEDEIIPPKSSIWAYEQIGHDNKRLYFLQGAYHRMLYDGRMEQSVFVLIDAMLADKIF